MNTDVLELRSEKQTGWNGGPAHQIVLLSVVTGGMALAMLLATQMEETE